MTTDSKSGLDIDLGERCSSTASDWAAKTFAARAGKTGEVDAGLRGSFSSLVTLAGARVGITSDGIGTKVEVAERTGVYATLGRDLVAMVADDLAANGFEPTDLSNVLDVDRLDERVVGELMRGLAEAALEAGIAVAGGEVAELGTRVGGWGSGMHLNWCATAIGVLPARLDRPIDGAACAPGDAVVAVREDGLRSNGFSLARKILGGALGDRWHEERCASAGMTWGEALLGPSRLCCPLVRTLIESGVVPHGLAHVTGGGIPGKLGRVLKLRGLGARIDAPFDAPGFVRELVDLGKVPAAQAWRHWGMGHAMLLVVAPGDVDGTLAAAAGAGRDYEARVVGRVEAGHRIRIAPVRGEAMEFEVQPA